MRPCSLSCLTYLSEDLPPFHPYSLLYQIHLVVGIDRDKFFLMTKDDEVSIPFYSVIGMEPHGQTHGSQETPTRGEHPVPEDQFTHG